MNWRHLESMAVLQYTYRDLYLAMITLSDYEIAVLFSDV
jgi:hypothetical protein